jgi:hypothetical protein
MSCRIDQRVIGEDLVVLCISGQITGEDVRMLRDVLGQEAGVLAIDLKNVFLVAREAVKLLARCETNGTELRNCPRLVIRIESVHDRGKTATITGRGLNESGIVIATNAIVAT